MSRYAVVFLEPPGAFFGKAHAVVDTHAPVFIDGEYVQDRSTGELLYKRMCLCEGPLQSENAREICNALNAAEAKR